MSISCFNVSDAQFTSWIKYYAPNDTNVANCVGMNKFYSFIAGKVKPDSGNWDIHVMRYSTFAGQESGPYIYSTSSSEEPVALSASRSSQYFFVTALSTDSAGKKSTLILKMFENGTIIRSSKLATGSDTNEIPVSVAFNQDRSRLYIVSKVISGSNSNFLTRSIDTAGNVLWKKVFDANQNDVPVSLTFEGAGIYVTGTTYDSSGYGRIVTLKYDTSGTMQWNRIAAKPFRSLNASNINSRGIVAVCGNDSGSLGSDIITILYSSNGDSIWQKTFSGIGNDFASTVKVDFNFNVIVGGSSYRDSARGNDMCIIKYFQNGDSGWVNYINGRGSGNDSLTGMSVDGFNCIFVTGRCPDLNGYDAFGSALINTIGFYHWTNFVQSNLFTGNNIPYALVKFDGQNTFVVTGTTFGSNRNSYTSLCYLGVLDGIEVSSNLLPGNLDITTYPNPFNPTTTILFRLEEEQLVTLEIFDITGRSVTTLVKGKVNRGIHEVRLDASMMTAGVYFARLEAGDALAVKKLVLVK